MNTFWILQVVVITLIAGLGLGFAIRFSLATRGPVRFRRIAPHLGSEAVPATNPASDMRRAPTV